MRGPLILGIAGGTGSGKTTIADRIAAGMGTALCRLDHDSYYRDHPELSFEDRQRINFDHPDALDNALLAAHLDALRAGQAIEKPSYDFQTHRRTTTLTRLEPAPLVLVEGILCLAIPALREHFDVKIFVDTAADIRLMRRIRRDLEVRGRSFEEVRAQYLQTVRPMHLAFVEPSKRYADIIIPEGGNNQIAIELLLGHLREFLRGGA